MLYNRSGLAGVRTRVLGVSHFHFLSRRTALHAAASQTRPDGKPSVDAYQARVRRSF